MFSGDIYSSKALISCRIYVYPGCKYGLMAKDLILISSGNASTPTPPLDSNTLNNQIG